MKVRKLTIMVIGKVQCEVLIKEFSLKVNFTTTIYTCFNKCSKLTEQELQRIKPKKFNNDWVEKINNFWLCHVEGEGMFCIICKKTWSCKSPEQNGQIFWSSI